MIATWIGAGLRWALVACVAANVGGCARLLPRAHSQVTSPWSTFEQARDAIMRIVPYETTVADLAAAGIDPYGNPNVQLLTYSDVMLRFPGGHDGFRDRLDRGLRECLEAGKACHGYSIAVRDVKRDRVGDFWLDALSFKRIVELRGWSFNALILLVDDRVVYTLYGGQPQIREVETSRQPLGPVQNWGEHVPEMAR